MIAISWLVYRTTNSAFLLGLVGFSSQIPIFIFTPIAGVLADRFSKHRIILITQTLSMIQAIILTVLVFTNTITIWQIIVLSLFLGLVNAFDAPTRQSFVVEMVDDKNDLANAIALNSSLFNGARLVGPSIAGLLIAAFGEGYCFLVNAISYLAVIVSLLLMTLSPHVKKKESHVFKDLKEGLIYAYKFSQIRNVLLFLGTISLIGMPYVVLMPMFVKDVLHAGPDMLGFLMASSGIGALFGAYFLATRKTVVGLGDVIAFSAFVFGLGLIILSLSNIVWLSIAISMVIGFGIMVQMASSNTILQTLVSHHMRGRVMSLFTIAFLGLTPFGSLFLGSLAAKVGVQHTLLATGTTCLVAVIIFYLNFVRKDKLTYSELQSPLADKV